MPRLFGKGSTRRSFRRLRVISRGKLRKFPGFSTLEKLAAIPSGATPDREYSFLRCSANCVELSIFNPNATERPAPLSVFALKIDKIFRLRTSLLRPTAPVRESSRFAISREGQQGAMFSRRKQKRGKFIEALKEEFPPDKQDRSISDS